MSCPRSDPADARSLRDNILVRLRPTPETHHAPIYSASKPIYFNRAWTV